MRLFYFLSASLLTATIACNNGSSTTASTDSTVTTHDTMSDMHHDTAAAVDPLPAIPAGAKVFFKNLKNGETVKSPFKVLFGVEGIKLDTAGHIIAGSGHHHLFIDAEDSLAAGTVVPKDSTHLHFGKAQTETTLTLPAGKHKLALQYADGIHRSYGGALSKTITVTVK